MNNRKNRRKNGLESSIAMEHALRQWWYGQTRYISMAQKHAQDTLLGEPERFTRMINGMFINFQMLLLFRPVSLLSYARTAGLRSTLASTSTERRLRSLQKAIADTNNSMLFCVEHVLELLSALVTSTVREATDSEHRFRRDQLLRISARMIQQCEEILRNIILSSLWFSTLPGDDHGDEHLFAFRDNILPGQQGLASLHKALWKLIRLTIRLNAAPSQYRQSLSTLLDQLKYLENYLNSPGCSTNRRTSTAPAAPWLNNKARIIIHLIP
ncbi:hypothetical protein [Paenibacillus piscarius]|uniref:hypothetical protein n=1 Tax=Paenibacillus piscarius TaxID=1089681 RepID=UPI001EE9763C|nr:hypothetical protein [Paenibacillus piscarius]